MFRWKQQLCVQRSSLQRTVQKAHLHGPIEGRQIPSADRCVHQIILTCQLVSMHRHTRRSISRRHRLGRATFPPAKLPRRPAVHHRPIATNLCTYSEHTNVSSNWRWSLSSSHVACLTPQTARFGSETAGNLNFAWTRTQSFFGGSIGTGRSRYLSPPCTTGKPSSVRLGRSSPAAARPASH
jgi:hypothetical protein